MGFNERQIAEVDCIKYLLLRSQLLPNYGFIAKPGGGN